MNKIYKVVWSKLKSCYVVTSEFGKSRTKSSGSGKGAGKASVAAVALTAFLSCTGLAGAAYNVTVGSDGKLPSGTPVIAGDASDLLTKTDANTTYLTKVDANTTYATKTDLLKEETERKANDTALEGKIGKVEDKTTNISYNAGGGTNVDGVNIKNGDMSGVKKINDITVNNNALGNISTLETTGDVKVGGDLTVKGKFMPDEVLIKDDHNNLTDIKAGSIESKNANFTGDIHDNTIEGSKLNFDTNGFGVSAVGMGITGGNGAEMKLQKDKISQEVLDADGNSNSEVNTSTKSTHTVTSGTAKTTVEQTAADINLTAEDGNINNKAKNITNTTTEDMTNTIGKDLTTTVGGNQSTAVGGDQSTDVTGNQSNTVSGHQSNTVSGNLTESVAGDVTEDYKANQTTKVGGDRTEIVTGDVVEYYKKDQTTTVDGNQGTDVKGDQTNTVGGKLTETVTGDVVENYKANQTTTVDKNQTTHVKGDQTNTVGGKLTETVEGDVVEDYKGDQTTTVGGDRITDVKGNDVLTAENITHTAKTQLINNVGTTSMTMTVTNTTFNNDVVMNNNLDVAGDVKAASYKIGSKTYIDNDGINANEQKIINVADGTLSDTSLDAVNGSQLFRTNQRIERWNRDLSRVGAGAAALAGLHPVDYDATSKLSFAVGFGSYKSEHAAAIGAFYRPNDNILFGVSSTVGYGDNMYNASLSFKFGEGSHERGISKAAQRKIDTLQNKVSLLEARLDNILNIFNPNAYKDFPDIPENHWAYEAVSTLAGNGIVEGYPDGDYHGDRTMTRYEMAMIIYNALKRGVQADMKLVREFQPELSMIEANTR